MKQLFLKLDKNGDGTLAIAEMKKGMIEARETQTWAASVSNMQLQFSVATFSHIVPIIDGMVKKQI